MKRTRADHHILGSEDGYRTIFASAGITESERRALEVLGFGQTDDKTYCRSLVSIPAAFGRCLPTGRYAVTRCFCGSADSAGRQTFLFATVVLSAKDWLEQWSRHLRSLVCDEQLWRTVVSKAAPVELKAAEQSHASEIVRHRSLLAVDAIVRSGGDCTVYLIDSPEASDAVMTAVALLPAPRRCSISWGIRVLSIGLGFELCSVHESADLGSRRKAIRLREDADLQTIFAQSLDHFWRPDGDLPIAIIEAGEPSGAVDGRCVPDRKPRYRLFQVAIAALSVTVACLGGVVIFAATRSEPEVVDQSQAATPNGRAATLPVPQSPAPSLTPNEREAQVLTAAFDNRGDWSVKDLEAWVLVASSLFHVEQISGFAEAEKKAALAKIWVGDVNGVISEFERAGPTTLMGPVSWLGRDEELEDFVQRATLLDAEEIGVEFASIAEQMKSQLQAVHRSWGELQAAREFFATRRIDDPGVHDITNFKYIVDNTFSDSIEGSNPTDDQTLPGRISIHRIRDSIALHSKTTISLTDLLPWWHLIGSGVNATGWPDDKKPGDVVGWVDNATSRRLKWLDSAIKSDDHEHRSAASAELAAFLAGLEPLLGDSSFSIEIKRVHQKVSMHAEGLQGG